MKVRFRHAKLGKVRFLSHRDVARIWERALRKSELAVAYSEGFTPRPRVAFGLALPTGAQSCAEYVDVDLIEDTDAASAIGRLDGAFPRGIDLLAAEVIDRTSPSLQEDVLACSWKITLSGITEGRLGDVVERVLGSRTLEITRERKGERSVDDVRPGIEHLHAVSDGDGVHLVTTLATKPRGIRPSELLDVCHAVITESEQGTPPWQRGVRLVRTAQLIERDGARRELLPLQATSA